jgi:hypothetical protein
MNNAVHQTLANGRWQTFSLSEQLGNIGSEIERAIKWGERGDAEHRAKALERSMELLDLTLADSRWNNYRLQELANVREVVNDTFFGKNEYGSSPEAVARYFFPFACAARLGR